MGLRRDHPGSVRRCVRLAAGCDAAPHHIRDRHRPQRAGAIRVDFDEPINPASFTADLLALAAPSGPINSEQLSVTPIATTILPGLELYASFEVRFPTQTEPGDYQFFVLPRVTDLSGNLLDQSGNGV